MKLKQTGSIFENHGLWYYSVKLPGERRRRQVPLKAPGAKHTLTVDRPRKMAEDAAARYWEEHTRQAARHGPRGATVADLCAAWAEHCREYYKGTSTAVNAVLDEGLKEMAAAKAACENKMRRWSGIAERSQKLSECFTALVEDADFMRMIDDFDVRTSEMFKGERIPTLGGWVRLGIRFTAAMRDGASLPAKYTAKLNTIQREITSATAVRNILHSFVSASDDDYRLRYAPEKYRSRVFRDLAQDFSDIVSASATIDLVMLPDTVNGIADALKIIIDIAKKMQGVCRRAKKDIKRHGPAFWTHLDKWNAMRSVV